MKRLLRLLVLAGLLLAGGHLAAAESIPPVPPHYFNDYAGVVSRATADRLNARLEQFERDSSNQLLVVLYPRMESGSSVEDYTVRVAQAWRVGRQGLNNGAVLFAFMQEHQLYIQVGYGLEPRLTDATAKRIIEGEIVPRFRAGDIDGGMTAAVTAMIAATKGEYRGTGRTVADADSGSPVSPTVIFWVIFGGWIAFQVARQSRNRPSILRNPARRGGTWWIDTGGSGGGSSWGGGFGGGGGFSGGGGSFGGGGAGGKW